MFFSEFTRTKWHCAIAISQFGFCVIAKWVFTTLYVAISPQLHASILGELLLWSLNYYSFVIELSCGHWTDCLFWTMRTKHIKQKNSNKNLFLEYLCFHLSVDTWRKSCSNWVHTWPGWRCEYVLKSSSEKLILNCWVMVLLFLKGASHQV